MNSNSYHYILLGVIVTLSMMARCSDDDTLKVYMPDAKSIVHTNFDVDDTVSYTATLVGADYPTVSVSSGNTVTVDFKIDADQLTTFNASMGTNYVLLPSENFVLETSGTISKGGKSTEPLKLIVKNGNLLEPFSTYVLPVSIEKVNGAEISDVQRTTFFVLTRSPAVENLPAFDRSAWTIADKSTQEPAEGNGNGLAIAAIDGNWNSYWHSKWAGGEPAPPHYITIDMGEEKVVHAIAIVDRNLGDWAHGQPKDVTISVSTDGATFEVVATKSLDMKSNPQEEIRFFLSAFKSARYLKVTVNSTYGGTNSTSLGEVYAL